MLPSGFLSSKCDPENMRDLKKEIADQLKDGPVTMTLEGLKRKQVEDIEP